MEAEGDGTAAWMRAVCSQLQGGDAGAGGREGCARVFGWVVRHLGSRVVDALVGELGGAGARLELQEVGGAGGAETKGKTGASIEGGNLEETKGKTGASIEGGNLEALALCAVPSGATDCTASGTGFTAGVTKPADMGAGGRGEEEDGDADADKGGGNLEEVMTEWVLGAVVCACVRVYKWICTCIHAYIHACIHTYTQIYIHT